ncbi:MAG: ribosome biogenesis GTP-binding protein YihA/YsxC [Acidobacteriota bacterium]|nr:ribosome biogenesis GTP-binding protein YihA/YsxC [Acidobacteriota bacterium]
MKVFTRFMLSAVAPQHFPPAELPEVAFLGRSNVGKSSLINSLVSAKVAKTSNTPGRTQAINFFELRWPGRPKAELVFADLPGYGYAKVPREVSRSWPEFIEPYLADRETLALSLCLVDANIPPQASDTQMIDYLKQTGRPLLVVATKADRVGTRLHASLNALRKAHGVEHVLAYSSKTGLGQDELWRRLRAVNPPEEQG